MVDKSNTDDFWDDKLHSRFCGTGEVRHDSINNMQNITFYLEK